MSITQAIAVLMNALGHPEIILACCLCTSCYQVSLIILILAEVPWCPRFLFISWILQLSNKGRIQSPASDFLRNYRVLLLASLPARNEKARLRGLAGVREETRPGTRHEPNQTSPLKRASILFLSTVLTPAISSCSRLSRLANQVNTILPEVAIWLYHRVNA